MDPASLRRQLYNALLKAFPRPDDLRRLTYLWLNERLDAIAGGSTTEDIVFNLLQWADANDQRLVLVQAAVAENPDNPELRAAANALGLTSPAADQTITIPFVVAAMTSSEAETLVNLEVFNSDDVTPRERNQFIRFRQVLQEQHGIAELLSYYGEKRESWKPQQAKPIGELITGMVDRLNSRTRQTRRDSPPLQPQLVSTVFLDQESPVRNEVWRNMNQLGYILIVDAVSLFHPVLRQRLLQSQMGASEQLVSMVVLSPISSRRLLANQILEEELGKQMQRAFARFNEEFDLRCELGVGDLVAMQRWLAAILSEVMEARQTQKPNVGALENVRDLLRVHSTSGRMQDLISGRVEAERSA